MTEYESAPGLMFHNGVRFECPCGNSEFRVEIGTSPARFWCTCGEMYTEQIVADLVDGASS